MSAAKSHVPSRAPPAGSVASGRSRKTVTSRLVGEEPETERRKSVTSYRAPTVVPADSISQADPTEYVSLREGGRSAKTSQVGSTAGSQRLTAEALQALSEHNSNAGRSRATATHKVEVIEETTSPQRPAQSRATSKSHRSSHIKAPSVRGETVRSSHVSRDQTVISAKAASRATTRAPTAAPSKAASKAASRATTRPATGAASESDSDSSDSDHTPYSKAASAAPSHRTSRRSSVHVVEVTEQAEAQTPRAKSVAPSHYTSANSSHADRSAANPPAASQSVAPSRARSRAPSHAPSHAHTAASSHHTRADDAKTTIPHRSSHPPAQAAASRAPSHAPSHAPSRAPSHRSAATSAKSSTSHATSHHSSDHDHSTAPTSPASPTPPQPPPAFEEKVTSATETKAEEENMQLVKRSSYDVVAPRDTRVDIVEFRRRDGRLLEREYGISPSRERYWQPTVSIGVADGTVYKKQYRRRRPQRVIYMRRLSSYDGY